MEGYPRQQKLQKLLSVLDRTITASERTGDPGVMIHVRRGYPDAMVRLSYFDSEGLTERRIDLAGEMGLGVGETIGLLRLAHSSGYILRGHVGLDNETSLAHIDHLEPDGYVLIGELPDPQERLALILDAAIQAAVQASDRPEEKKKWQGLRDDLRFGLRTLGVEGAKAVLRGELPPM